ncbi:MAG: BlaI/MecI/CopY family transcriptional regulator [Candidatus Latescibacter sp.]|nr:BlaI/MecI/CopY family transcriptional regulator [Candidatus Latescibacter sp.]
MSELRLGRVQMRIMQVLWKKQRATAQEITDEINKLEPIKHSTVQTFLRVLAKKKIVAFDVEKRTFVYYPMANSESVTQSAVRNFIDTTFSGSLEGMISYIIKNVDISPEQLEKIKKLLDEEEKF